MAKLNTVYAYKGFEIQFPSPCIPANGDQPRYVIDSYSFIDKWYDTLHEAIEDIDRNEKFIDEYIT